MDEESLMLKKLGARIAVLRKQKGMNQEEFAEISGKMINTISNIERGISDPKVTTLLSLAKALDIPIESLFGASAQQIVSEDVMKIFELIKDEDVKTINVIYKQIEALLELTK